jgi:methionyl-tRNA synthetase
VPEFQVDYDKYFAFDLKTDWDRYDFFMKNLKFDEALNVIWENVRRCNAYIDKEKPWELATQNRDVLADVIYNLLETIRQTAIMLMPFMPQKADNILEHLGYDAEKVKEKKLDDLRKWATLKKGQAIEKGESLFPRLA